MCFNLNPYPVPPPLDIPQACSLVELRLRSQYIWREQRQLQPEALARSNGRSVLLSNVPLSTTSRAVLSLFEGYDILPSGIVVLSQVWNW